MQEPPGISAVFNVPNSEAPAIRTDGQLPSISNYFSDTNKNNFLFETVSKYNSIITKSTTPPDFNFSNSPSPHPVATTPTPTEIVSFSPISVHHSSTHSLYSEPVEKLPVISHYLFVQMSISLSVPLILYFSLWYPGF